MSKRRRPVTYLCPNSGDNREKYLGKPAHTNSMAGLQAVQWRRRCSETAMSASAAYSGIRSTSACAAQPVPSAKSSSHRLEAKIRAYPPKRCTPRLSNTCPCHKQGFVYLKTPRLAGGSSLSRSFVREKATAISSKKLGTVFYIPGPLQTRKFDRAYGHTNVASGIVMQRDLVPQISILVITDEAPADNQRG
jgi:hypothetical protein